MSFNNIELPNEAIRLILLHCQTPKDYLSQSLMNRQWLDEARRIRLILKRRFARQIVSLNDRFIIWNFDVRATVIGHGQHLQRHGLEECVQIYHRVGGPGASVYYLERYWQEGRLHGLEIVREINEIWYSHFHSNENRVFNEQITHPYNGLSAVDSMRKHQRHLLVPKNSILPKNCDYLGEILFQHEWNSSTLENSQEFERKLLDERAQSDVDALFNYLRDIDVQQISMQECPIRT